MRKAVGQTFTVLEMIKFQHSIFALPFALTSMLIAAGGMPRWYSVFWIVLACVSARTAAMSFNRWADADLDGRNPRTAGRAIPAGRLSKRFVLGFAVGAALLFIFCAAMLNHLALLLSPLALVVLLGYSFTKRFTSLSHLVLGLALGIAPVGAWIAIRGEIAAVPVLLGLGVLLWTAGFDLIYSCQDYDVDRRQRLFSIPARLGIPTALRLSMILHACTVLTFVAAGFLAHMHWMYYAGVGVVAALLAAEHLVVDPDDPRRINAAFFTVNSWVGLVMLAATAADVHWMR